LLELVMPEFLRPVARTSIHQPHFARSEHENDVFARFPVRSRRPRGSAAHAWRHPLRMVAHAKCFLGTQSPACRAGRGATISPPGCPCDGMSRTVIAFFAWSPARSHHRARDGIILRLPFGCCCLEANG
jgi:hypothetical protein